MSQMQVRLSRYDAQPWGFRLQGGTDFGTPLVVQKVSFSMIYFFFFFQMVVISHDFGCEFCAWNQQ